MQVVFSVDQAVGAISDCYLISELVSDNRVCTYMRILQYC